MNITIQVEGLSAAIAKMSNLEKSQLPYALARALTKTAQDVQSAEVKEMERTLDRPTPYTLDSLYIKPATKTNPTATVYFSDSQSCEQTSNRPSGVYPRGKDKSSAGKGTPAVNYISPQIAGGERNLKRFESALQRIGVLPRGLYIAPGQGCSLDIYGNIPASLIVQILSYFKAFGEQGYFANITEKRKAALNKGNKRTGALGFQYFVSYGKGTASGRQHLPAGIYKRIGFSQGSAIKPIMMFVKKPSYSKRFPFYELAQKVAKENFPKNFNEAMSEAIRTAK